MQTGHHKFQGKSSGYQPILPHPIGEPWTADSEKEVQEFEEKYQPPPPPPPPLLSFVPLQPQPPVQFNPPPELQPNQTVSHTVILPNPSQIANKSLPVSCNTSVGTNTSSNGMDAEELFLMSLLPTLRRLNAQQRSLAMIRITQVLYETEFGSASDSNIIGSSKYPSLQTSSS